MSKIVKVKAIQNFTDSKEEVYRTAGDEFECTEERANQLVNFIMGDKAYPLVEVLEEVATDNKDDKEDNKQESSEEETKAEATPEATTDEKIGLDPADVLSSTEEDNKEGTTEEETEDEPKIEDEKNTIKAKG